MTIRSGLRLESIRNQVGGKAGLLTFVEQKTRGEFEFPFIQRRGKFRLMNGALYPMLASFRWMVVEDAATDAFAWRGGFDEVLDRWRRSADELMRVLCKLNAELGRNPNAIGKSRNHWANLHARCSDERPHGQDHRRNVLTSGNEQGRRRDDSPAAPMSTIRTDEPQLPVSRHRVASWRQLLLPFPQRLPQKRDHIPVELAARPESMYIMWPAS